jgi:hypothetical protein
MAAYNQEQRIKHVLTMAVYRSCPTVEKHCVRLIDPDRFPTWTSGDVTTTSSVLRLPPKLTRTT